MSSGPHYEADETAAAGRWDNDHKTNIIKPRGLNIIWGNDQRYWSLPKDGNDVKPAELLQVCWLEVSGSVTVAKGRKYQIGFNISLKPDAFGWSRCPVFLMAKLGKKGRYPWRKKTQLDQLPQNCSTDIPENYVIEVPDTATETELHFGLYEVWSGRWKGGLVIHHAFVKEV